MARRLFVDELTSVGLVKSPDDEEAKVAFWKAKPKQDSSAEIMKRADRALARADRYLKRKRENPMTHKQDEPTVGEVVSKAVDRRARDFHLNGQHTDVPLSVLRTRIRKNVPGLKDLERSTEPSSEIRKQDTEASRFVSEWS